MTAWRPATTSASSVMDPAPVRRQEVEVFVNMSCSIVNNISSVICSSEAKSGGALQVPEDDHGSLWQKQQDLLERVHGGV